MVANVIYSDFMVDLDVHPVTGDAIRAINDYSVKRAVRALLFTNKGERFFQPQIGSGLKHFLFEPMTPQTTYLIQQAIIETLTNFEPRITQLDVVVIPDYDKDAYSITIAFYILNISDPISLSLTLNRLR